MRRMLLAACLLFGAAQAAHNPLAEAEAGTPRYQSEWWRLSASLVDTAGRSWDLEWALYRQHANGQQAAGALQASPMSLAHAAITTPDGQYYEQRFEHGGIARADAGAPREIPVADDPAAGWQWVSRGAALFPARLSFSLGDRDLNLLLESVDGPAGTAEPAVSTARGHAASEPLLRVRGFIDQGVNKTYLRGRGRLDREWQAPLLAGDRASGD